jgi:hypothetical protein
VAEIHIQYGIQRGLRPRDGDWQTFENDGTAVLTIKDGVGQLWRYNLPLYLNALLADLARNVWGLPETHLAMLRDFAAQYAMPQAFHSGE